VRKIIEAQALRIEDVEGPESYDGELIPEQRLVRINIGKPRTRQRFTLAHELGHWVLYHKDRLHDFPDDDAETSSRDIEDSGYDEEDPFDDEDWVPDPEMEDFWAEPVDLGPTRRERDREADIFAAELLMPTKWVRAHWRQHGPDVPTLARLYGVSEEAMWTKVQNLGLLKK
jgi:Zn-dependent peptidase ImmA (M78 family)